VPNPLILLASAYSPNLPERRFSESPHRFAVGCSSLGTFSSCFSELGGARDGGDAVLRGEAGDRTDQESRSEGTEPQVDFFLPDG
jgi:hypothetical protein